MRCSLSVCIVITACYARSTVNEGRRTMEMSAMFRERNGWDRPAAHGFRQRCTPSVPLGRMKGVRGRGLVMFRRTVL